MVKLFLLLVLAFGAFMGLSLFVPHVWDTFAVLGKNIPYIAVGVGVIGYIGYKAIK